MNLSNNPDLCERLAAEYALGTLRGGARRRFERLLRDHSELRKLAAQWEDLLAPLAESIPETRVPARVWQALLRRIPTLAGRERAPTGWFSSLALWRTATVASIAVAVFAVGIARLGLAPGEPSSGLSASAGEARYVATFADPTTGRAVALVYTTASGSDVSFKVLDASLEIGANQTLELWTAAPQGKGMLPAGLVPAATSDAVLRFAVPDANALRSASLLGLSLEPAGGSPAPTHVLGVAHWVRIDT